MHARWDNTQSKSEISASHHVSLVSGLPSPEPENAALTVINASYRNRNDFVTNLRTQLVLLSMENYFGVAKILLGQATRCRITVGPWTPLNLLCRCPWRDRCAATGTAGVRRDLPGSGRADNEAVRRTAATLPVHDRPRAGDESLRQRHRLFAPLAVPPALDQLVHRRLQDRGVGLQHWTGARITISLYTVVLLRWGWEGVSENRGHRPAGTEGHKP